MTEKKCPKCNQFHEFLGNECACCKKEAVEVGIHYPILCLECTKVLAQVRDEVNTCPNCGSSSSGIDKDEFECFNHNCRVNSFEPESSVDVYERIREKRGVNI